MNDIRLEVGSKNYLRAASCYIRMDVFVLENGLDPDLEFDAYDTDGTVYSVIFNKLLPVATARFLPIDEDIARITRVATLKNYRGKDLGRKVVVALEEHALKNQFKQIVIHSELVAKGFYESLGYVVDGDIYLEDGVECISLIKKIA